jgi:hypothetical protein
VPVELDTIGADTRCSPVLLASNVRQILNARTTFSDGGIVCGPHPLARPREIAHRGASERAARTLIDHKAWEGVAERFGVVVVARPSRGGRRP